MILIRLLETNKLKRVNHLRVLLITRKYEQQA